MDKTAVSKIYLHMAKYPHCAVNGILLGKRGKLPDNHPTIVDAIPLFHVNLAALPYLEIALSQIETYCSEEGLAICGYYHVQSAISDDKPDLYVLKVLEKLNENCSDKVLLFMLKNSKLNTKEMPYTNYECRDGKLNIVQTIQAESGSIELAMALIKKGAYKNLVDFDNHLDNLGLDWLNRNLTN